MKRKNILINLAMLLTVILVVTITINYQSDFIIKSKLDKQRKTDINNLFFYLTQDYYLKNEHYPEFLEKDSLKQKLSITDPQGKVINSADSDYTYTTYNCHNNKCQGFVLKAKLDLEQVYQKQS